MAETSDVMRYPPLTPLDELPLHPEAHWLPGQWWACEHPERPHDDGTRYDWRCENCVVGAEASLHHGDIDMDWRPSEYGEPVELPGTQSGVNVVRTVVWYPQGDVEVEDGDDAEPFVYIILGPRGRDRGESERRDASPV